MMVGVEGIVEVVFTVVDGKGVASLMVTANPFFWIRESLRNITRNLVETDIRVE